MFSLVGLLHSQMQFHTKVHEMSKNLHVADVARYDMT